MDIPADVRKVNRKRLRHLGYGKVPDEVGDPPAGPVRSADAVVDRALALHVVVSVADGFGGDAGLRLATGLGVELHDDEREYLEDVADGVRVEDAARATQVECLAELVWALGVGEEPPDDARAELPEVPESTELRDTEALAARYDLLAGMAWALQADTELEIGDAPGSVDPYVVRQRLRALAWVLGADW